MNQEDIIKREFKKTVNILETQHKEFRSRFGKRDKTTLQIKAKLDGINYTIDTFKELGIIL